MDAIFYERNSFSKVVEGVFRGAVEQAESFQVVLNEHLRFHFAQERLKELQPQLNEQSEKVSKLRKELEKAEGNKKMVNQVPAIQEEYRIESGALDEIARACNVLNGVKPPVVPDWLTDFLKEVVS